MNTTRRGKKFCSRVFTMGRRRWITPTRVGGQVWAGVSTGIFAPFLVVLVGVFYYFIYLLHTCSSLSYPTTSFLRMQLSFIIIVVLCHLLFARRRSEPGSKVMLPNHILTLHTAQQKQAHHRHQEDQDWYHLFDSTTHNRVSMRNYLPAMLFTAA
jgi:hypothetical protein